MTERSVTTIAEGFNYLECPRWHDGRVWLSDFYAHRVIAVSLDGHVETICDVPHQPSGLGWLPDGRLLIVSMKDRKLLCSDGTTLEEYADLTDVVTGHPNDMVVDANGRAYIGSFGFDLMGGGKPATADLLMVDTDQSVSVVARDLRFPNGSVITPDGRTLIVDETLGNRISAFDIHDDGTLGERRDWANFGPQVDSESIADLIPSVVFAPDGNTLDAEGCVWAADAVGGRVARIREGGEIVEEIRTGTGLFACGLGGEDGRTLFLCAAPDFDEHARSAAREAALMAVTVDVPHAGLP